MAARVLKGREGEREFGEDDDDDKMRWGRVCLFI